MIPRVRHALRRVVGRRWSPLLLLLALVGALAVTSPAAAHLGLSSTDPVNGAQLSRSPTQLTLVFTQAATPAGSGIRVLDGDGGRVQATVSSADDGVTWQVTPTEPLPSGTYRLAWKVVAGDAHAKSGAVRFRVAARSDAGAPPVAATTALATAHRQASAVAPGAAPVPSSEGDTQDGDSGGAWAVLGALGRWLGIVGVLVAIGAMIVTITTLVGSEGDVALAAKVVRRAALAAALGAVVEAGHLVLTLASSVPVGAGAAVLARLAGGVVLATATGFEARRSGGRRSHDVRVLPPEPVPGGRGAAQLLLAPPVRTGRVRAVLTRPAPVALASVCAICSFLLDGHTASVGPRPVMMLADVLHTTGAAVWAGGVVLLACLLLVRARAGVPTGAGELAVRFSVPASAAAAAVAGAGTVLLMLIIDGPSDLLTTSWGRVMTVKLALVGAVALLGYANNRYALPALDAWQPHTARMLRRTVAVEGAVMIVVLVATAVLVASQM